MHEAPVQMVLQLYVAAIASRKAKTAIVRCPAVPSDAGKLDRADSVQQQGRT